MTIRCQGVSEAFRCKRLAALHTIEHLRSVQLRYPTDHRVVDIDLLSLNLRKTRVEHLHKLLTQRAIAFPLAALVTL